MASTSDTFHDVPANIYRRLAELFGESNGAQVCAPDTFWVNFGAGSAALTFFPAEGARVQDDAAPEPPQSLRVPDGDAA